MADTVLIVFDEDMYKRLYDIQGDQANRLNTPKSEYDQQMYNDIEWLLKTIAMDVPEELIDKWLDNG